MKQLYIWFVLAISIFTLAACGDPEPPHHGVFIQEGRDFVSIPMSQGPTNDNLYQIASSAPATDEPMPTIVLWEPAVWLGDLGLSRVVGGIGVGLSFSEQHPQITNFSDFSSANHAGLQRGDFITAIDGMSTNGVTDIDAVRHLVQGPINEYMSIDVDRDGQALQFDVLRVPIDRESIPYTSSSEGDIWIMEPGNELNPGHYCFVAGNPTLPFARLPTWCFRVQN